MNLNTILIIFQLVSTGTGIIVIIFAYLLLNPAKLIMLWNLGARVLYRLRLLKKKKAQEANLLGHLNSAIARLRTESPGVFSHSAKIQWIKSGDDFAKLQDGDVILNISGAHDEESVLLAATMLYLKHGVVSDARPFIDRRLLKAIDISLAQSMLFGTARAYEYLQTIYVDPVLGNAAEAEFLHLSENLKEAGVLTRVVLLEFSGLGNTLKGKSPTSRTRSETVNFAKFVDRIVKRHESEMAQLRFFGRLFTTTVALVADPRQAQFAGIQFYQRKFRNDIESGTRTIHLLARGMKNVQLTRRLAGWARDEGLVSGVLLSSFYEDSETGERVPAACITCISRTASQIVGLTPVDEVYSVLADIVPEILEGKVEVVSVGRESGVRTKIIVRGTAESENPARYFVGTNGENIDKLKALLSTTEEIDYINWTVVPADLIVQALYPLRPEEVLRVEVDKKTATATVVVTSKELVGLVIGVRGVNIRLAEQVTSYRILIEHEEKAPEEMARELLVTRVPPISSGDVAIRSLVHIPGEVTKVFVASESELNPALSCNRSCDVRALSHELGAEWLHFINYAEETEKRLINALYPLNPGEVLRVRIGRNDHAVVEVTTYEARREAVGRNGNNVKAAAKLTGFRITINVVDV